MSRLIALLFCGLAASAYAAAAAADSCSANVWAIPRAGGSWVASGKPYQIFDIVVANNNSLSCTFLDIVLDITSTAGNSVWSSWNIGTRGNIEFNGATIPPGGSFTGAGVVMTGASPSDPINVSVKSIICDSACAVASNNDTSSQPTTAPATCDPQVSQYAQNTITAVAFALNLGKFWLYTARPGSSGYGYALQNCLIYFESHNMTNGQSECDLIYVGNDQPFSIAVSSDILNTSRSYAYGLGIGDNAAQIALNECNCAIASAAGAGLACRTVQQSMYM